MLTKFKSIFLFIGSLVLICGCANLTKTHATTSNLFIPSMQQIPVSETTVHKISLLLPLKGKFAEQSQAIRNGFMAAYYSDQQNKSNINIKIIDTSNKDLGQLYDDLAATGTDVIVGPLTKPEVKTLGDKSSLPIPTIALNTLDNYQNKVTPNLYQYGLSPQDEALQVAAKMIKDGHNQVAIVAPNSASAQGIVNSFKSKFESLGGKTVTAVNFYAVDYDSQVRQLLGVDRAQLKHRKADEAIKHRDDINAIFLVASPQEARLIAPLFKYYADDIKVYATANIFNGILQPSLDSDLNGVIFCDIPWVLKSPNELSPELQDLHNKLLMLWSGSFNNNAKLYALGIDAYKLATSLNQLTSSPTAGIEGATGTLYLDKYNHIYRDLMWAEFQNGVPKPQ